MSYTHTDTVKLTKNGSLSILENYFSSPEQRVINDMKSPFINLNGFTKIEININR
jgi:hypothetical protein